MNPPSFIFSLMYVSFASKYFLYNLYAFSVLADEK